MKKIVVKIEKLDHFGRGIAYFDDKIIFVDNALPQEEVEVEVVTEKKNLMEGKVLRYIKESETRINPICPYYQKCGGCDLMHLSYSHQLEYKERKVKEILKKFTNFDNVKKIIGTCEFNYRNKITLQVKEKIGYFKKKSYEIIEINKCLIANDKINDVIKILKKINLENVEKIVIRYTNELMVVFYSKGKINLNIDDFHIVDTVIDINNDNKYVLKGKGYIIADIDNLKFIISPTSFFQINPCGMNNLYNKVLEYGQFTKEDSVLDLYCGTGSIGLFLSKYCGKVFGVEINKEAVYDALKNKEINNISNIDFKVGDVGTILKQNKFTPTAIIVDPPRAGLDKNTIDKIIELSPKKLIYVSCDPVTLARDLNILKEKYDIIELTPVDMFPNTYHVESVVLLKQK